MLILPEAAYVQLRSNSRRLTVAGVIYKNDGTTIRCTQHDEDLVIDSGDLAGEYEAMIAVSMSDLVSGSDLSVDNAEITGYLVDRLSFPGFNAADIEAGLFKNAPFEAFLLQWDDPDAWQKSLRRGYLGEIDRTAEGSFTAEWRGIVQVLQQTVGRIYGDTCDVRRFCDARCKLSLADFTRTGTVSAVYNNKRFDVDIDGTGFASGYFDLGEFSIDSGSNSHYVKQIKRDSADGTVGQIELWEAFPYDVQPGDAVHLVGGCDRTFETCQEKDNVINFRGHGRWAPGIPNIIRAP